MKKREAKWQTILNQYFRQKNLYCNFELKQTKSDSIAFDSVEKHQYEGLLAAQENGLVWKYSDQDQRQKPFDGSCNPPLAGYIIIKYPSLFVFIYVKRFMKEKEESTRKSLTLQRAKVIADKILLI